MVERGSLKMQPQNKGMKLTALWQRTGRRSLSVCWADATHGSGARE